MNKLKVGLYCFGKNHAIDKYFQILNLVEEMMGDSSRFELAILVDGTGIAEKDLRCRYEELIPFYDIREVSLNEIDLSILLIIDPYNKPYIPYEDITVPIVYKEYGVAGVEAGAGNLINRSIYKYADLIVTDNTYMKELVHKKYPNKSVVVASPAFDYIYEEYGDDERFDPKMKHVIWTPHHSIVPKGCYDNIVGGTYSTFLTYKDYFANEFLNNFKDVVLHIKPHPLLRGRYNYSFGKFNDYLKSFSDQSRVFVHEKENYHNLFLKSDLAINDSISFVQEWLPTNKPMIILRDEKQTPYSRYGEMIIDRCYYKAENTEDINLLVDGLLNNLYDPKKSARRDVSDLLYEDPGTPNSKSLCNILFSRYSRR